MLYKEKGKTKLFMWIKNKLFFGPETIIYLKNFSKIILR